MQRSEVSALQPRQPAQARSGESLRFALIIQMAPRKLGSLEDWLVGFVREARRRGHATDVFGGEPIHPRILQDFQGSGARWGTFHELVQRPVDAVRRLRRYHVVQLSFFDPSRFVTLLACLAWPARVLLADHLSGPLPGTITPRTVLRSRLRTALVFARIHSVAGVSNYVCERNRRLYGLPATKQRTIYDGVDLERFRRNPHATRDQSIVTVLCVAQLFRLKGVDLLIQAVAALRDPHVRLIIAGDGPDEASLRAAAAAAGIGEQTAFLGLRNDVEALMSQADIFAHPAIWEEAFGLVIAEAMASECAVVASRVGGIPEVILNEESGLLVTAGNVAELADALGRLIRDPHLRARLGRNARARVEARFGLDRCIQEHLQWCEEAAKR